MKGPRAFVELLTKSLDAWNERERFSELAAPLLDWLLEASLAERAFLVSPGSGRNYRVRASRDVDGESVNDAERWISHFAAGRALESGEPTLFPDTRSDRRFRTEGEQKAGFRGRSILVIPVEGAGGSSFFYLDSRFRPIEWSGKESVAVRLIRAVVRTALRLETLDGEYRTLARRLRRAESASPAAPPKPLPRPAASGSPREVDFHGFRTICPELIHSIEELRKLAPSPIPILIQGESGTGKEVLARAIHAESGRSGPFLSLHCGAIPASLVEIELFGHDRGAFTGAESQRSGLLELAHGGTIFLDDVGAMVLEMQNALLRVVETGRFRRVSGKEELEADVRVIAASLVAPGEQDGAGIRSDLYYRLAGATVTIPPLRERAEDVLPLLGHFFERYAETNPELDAELEAALVAHDWPGNVREVENLVRRVVALGEKTLTVERFHEITGTPARTSATDESGDDMRSVVGRVEREVILRTLQRCSGNKSLAAKMLGLSRKTLYRRMEKHGIPL